MQIDKETVLSLLREQGKNDEALEAEQELPDQVDTEQHASLLQRFGIEPQDLLSRFGGGNIPGF